MACGSRCDAFATCAHDGTVRVWDLSDFGVVAEAADRPQGSVRGGRALFLCWLGEDAVVTGWSDCSVRWVAFVLGTAAHSAVWECREKRLILYLVWLVLTRNDLEQQYHVP